MEFCGAGSITDLVKSMYLCNYSFLQLQFTVGTILSVFSLKAENISVRRMLKIECC